jgi:hypothetical protein
MIDKALARDNLGIILLHAMIERPYSLQVKKPQHMLIITQLNFHVQSIPRVHEYCR